MTALLLLALTACSGSILLDSRPVSQLAQAQAPSLLLKPCAHPVDVTGRLSAGAVERNWSTDRIALKDCGEKKDALAEFYGSLAAGLAGVPATHQPKLGRLHDDNGISE